MWSCITESKCHGSVRRAGAPCPREQCSSLLRSLLPPPPPPAASACRLRLPPSAWAGPPRSLASACRRMRRTRSSPRMQQQLSSRLARSRSPRRRPRRPRPKARPRQRRRAELPVRTGMGATVSLCCAVHGDVSPAWAASCVAGLYRIVSISAATAAHSYDTPAARGASGTYHQRHTTRLLEGAGREERASLGLVQ